MPTPKKQLTKLYFDRYFMIPARYSGKVYSKQSPTYLGLFSRKPEYGFLDFYGFNKTDTGVAHLDEIQNFFKGNKHETAGDKKDRLIPPEITKDHPAYMFSDQIVKLWTSFAETGKPTKIWGNVKEWKKTEYNEKPKLVKFLDTPMPIDEGNPSDYDKEVVEDIHKRADFWHNLYATDLAVELKEPPKEKF